MLENPTGVTIIFSSTNNNEPDSNPNLSATNQKLFQVLDLLDLIAMIEILRQTLTSKYTLIIFRNMLPLLHSIGVCIEMIQTCVHNN
jgi:hypothetical protein